MTAAAARPGSSSGGRASRLWASDARHRDPALAEQIHGPNAGAFTKRSRYGTGGYLQQAAEPDEGQQLVHAAHDVLVALGMGNHGAYALLEQPFHELVGADRHVPVG
jgi:hypothetical protein